MVQLIYLLPYQNFHHHLHFLLLSLQLLASHFKPSTLLPCFTCFLLVFHLTVTFSEAKIFQEVVFYNSYLLIHLFQVIFFISYQRLCVFGQIPFCILLHVSQVPPNWTYDHKLDTLFDLSHRFDHIHRHQLHFHKYYYSLTPSYYFYWIAHNFKVVMFNHNYCIDLNW